MPSQSECRVLVVGCGELGSRHLQAVACLPQVAEVEIVDPRPEALQLGQKRLAEVVSPQSNTIFRWLSSLEEASPGGDLCILSTRADVRCPVVEEVAKDLAYSRFILEKLVAQSVPEYQRLMGFAKERDLAIWVNCKTRAYGIHKRVKSYLDATEPLILSWVGANHGLATNGVHAADLFAFYDESERIESAGGHVDPVLHPSKRGNGLFDLSGTLSGYTRKGSQFSLSFARDYQGPDQVVIASPRYRCVVDHLQRWAYESDETSGWRWRPSPFEEDLLVSHMTKGFASDILRFGRCDLPTLEECFVAHRFILSELLPHFNNLMGLDGVRCPVT